MRRRSYLGALASSVGCFASGCLTPSGTRRYENPVYEPVFPDPTVVRTPDGIYYAYGSHQNRDVDENERLVPILRSRDLVEWEYVGEAFDEKPNWKAEGNLWAPNVVRLDGRYRLYYSYATWGDENPGIGVATAASPEGPFVDHEKLFRSDEIGVHNSIDPCFLLDDGTPYLFWGSHRGLYGIELVPDGRDYVPETKFQIVGDGYEAAHLFRRRGYYYLLMSGNTCCEGLDSEYFVAVARSRSLRGPYENVYGRIESSRDQRILHSGHAFVGPGHCTMTTDDARSDWLLYHAYDTTEPGRTGDGTWRRSLCLSRIEWEDEWPTVSAQTPSRVNESPEIE